MPCSISKIQLLRRQLEAWNGPAASEIRARDLITERVILEWENRASAGDRPQSALGVALSDGREVVIARAIEAFKRGRFLLLADNRQIDTLDETIAFTPGATVTFLRLTPLRGG